MKRFIWTLLIISAIAQPMSKTGIYLLFQANRAYIASNLCEKRQVPASTCQGKCFLNKELKKESEREQQTLSRKHASPDIIIVAPEVELSMVLPATEEHEKHASHTPGYYSTISPGIFHSPQL